MYLKSHRRFKDGKEHLDFRIAEKRRCAGGRVVDRHVLYLGEINASQKEAWLRCIEVFDESKGAQMRLALFPAETAIPEQARTGGIQVCLSDFKLRRPRQWGACWAFCQLWEYLGLDKFWRTRLPTSREGTSWYHVLLVLTAYRLIDPGSEWRLHRHWFEHSAMGDLLGEDFAIVAKDTLYRCLDKVLSHKDALFGHLRGRWQDLFGVKFEVLLYDLTSTYFESTPPGSEEDKRRFGLRRDHRPDCVQVVIALVVTVEGFPLAYEVLAGNTADSKTLEDFLNTIEKRYGRAQRIWIMDRGIPTEEHLENRRARHISYLVGTPKGRLTKLEKALTTLPWHKAREAVEVKLLPQDHELYVLVQSQARVSKERAMRRRRLRRLWKRLKELQQQRPSYETLLLKLGSARKEAGRAWSLVKLTLPPAPPKQERSRRVDFSFALNKAKLRLTRRREGRYLLRSNLSGTDPATLWELYRQLSEVEAAFKQLKGDLAVRPIYHQRENRIEAHLFVAFIAYCIQVTLKHRLRLKAPGLTARQALDKFSTLQMLDVHFPTTDGRELIFTRYTEPEPDQQLLLAQLDWILPQQPPPRITAKIAAQM
jgi:transposase